MDPPPTGTDPQAHSSPASPTYGPPAGTEPPPTGTDPPAHSSPTSSAFGPTPRAAAWPLQSRPVLLSVHCEVSWSMFIMIVLLLTLLTASGCLSSRVVGRTGENITFTCKYNRKSYGALSVCWNLGDIPSRGMCDNQLISTDGNKVKEQSGVSSRYQLMGRLDQGDVSLTILNLRENDTGRYGCRVDIPGWFNDEKHHFDLTVKGKRQLV
ncbi:hepatitis A virus cellular receptor 1 homolog [Acanthochromis polyacanthus]|uniref:hepatitis A virus cellular receptor 1 homolog n=1 Tax=Acanthochromis polyacanthus TaxID=80966 RepID=UPI00223460EF|nr:hepatitis A virus cellular receptor 1 homolog [Acanthochromis polyacanthus]